MKQKPTHKLLATLALLGLPFSVLAEEPTNTKPTTSVTIAKPATDAKAPEQPKPAEMKPTLALTEAKPAQPTPITSPVAKGVKTHVARKGETVSGIALRNGLTTEQLAIWNRLANADRLAIGQRLEIPAKTVKQTAAKLPPIAEGPKVHVVSKGETLGAIAKRYGVSTEGLAAWNHLTTPDRLEIGDRLEVPPASAAPRTVKKAPAPAAPTTAAVKPAEPEEIRITLGSK